MWAQAMRDEGDCRTGKRWAPGTTDASRQGTGGWDGSERVREMNGMAQSGRRGQDVEQWLWLWLWREEGRREGGRGEDVLLLPLLPAPVHWTLT